MTIHLSVVQRDERLSHPRPFSSPSPHTSSPTDRGTLPVRSSEMPKPKLLDQVREALRVRHYSLRTEDTYIHWIKRFILFHGKRLTPRRWEKARLGNS